MRLLYSMEPNWNAQNTYLTPAPGNRKFDRILSSHDDDSEQVIRASVIYSSG